MNKPLKIRIGYEAIYFCHQPTTMILMLNVHHTRVFDLVRLDLMVIRPWVKSTTYMDRFGNFCTRLVAPVGQIKLSASAVINDSGKPDINEVNAKQVPVEFLPSETLIFLLGSRYCETDLLCETAWSIFSNTSPGWSRVQAICDFVHNHITFGYQYASCSKTALDVFNEKKGVCRDFAHLAITFCRCMNIPARYCTGYLGDIGISPNPYPMDFSGWFEAYLDDKWYTFDPRNNTPRIGRVLIARGRDAADVAISTTFGPNNLERFKVWADEVVDVSRQISKIETQ